MSEFWDLCTSLWESCYNFLTASIVTIGSVSISLWEFALGFTLLAIAIKFFVGLFSE